MRATDRAATHRTDGPTGDDPGRAVGARGGVLDAVSGLVGHVLASGIAVVARVRQDKPLHPEGAVLHGRMTREGTGTSGVAWIDAARTDDVLVRWSRGGGLPASAPDEHGLALRLGEVDVLLSSVAGPGPVGRHVLGPSRDPGGRLYASLMPFRGPHGPVEIAAAPAPGRPLPASARALVEALGREPLVLRLLWARPTGPWHAFGTLEVHGAHGPTDGPVRFDPERAPTGLRTYRWITRLREPSYAVARRVHRTGASTDVTPTPTRPATGRSTR